MATLSPQTSPDAVLDVRDLPCRQRHDMIFRLWESLRVGEALVIVNDHDPVPLYYQVTAQYPDAFTWAYLETGPEVFRVRLERTRSTGEPMDAGPAKGVRRSGPPAEVDCRGLEPPEPLLRILNSAEALRAGQGLDARTDRKPMHLFAELERRGLSYSVESVTDGSWLTRIRRV
jgi:uncharacterized protein (DUF2249 family)